MCNARTQTRQAWRISIPICQRQQCCHDPEILVLYNPVLGQRLAKQHYTKTCKRQKLFPNQLSMQRSQMSIVHITVFTKFNLKTGTASHNSKEHSPSPGFYQYAEVVSSQLLEEEGLCSQRAYTLTKETMRIACPEKPEYQNIFGAQ